MGCDGQVTVGTTVMKHNAKKLRRLHHEQILAGFAGATADAFTLFEKFEAKLEERAQRHKRQGGSRYLLEPNVKEARAGCAICRRCIGSPNTSITRPRPRTW